MYDKNLSLATMQECCIINQRPDFMYHLACIKYPIDPNNRSYKPSRARWIAHYVRQIQIAIANGAAPAVSYTLRNLGANLSRLVIPPGLDPRIPAFVQHDAGISGRHTDAYAYESLNAKGRIALRATPAYHFEPIDVTTNHGLHAVTDGYTC